MTVLALSSERLATRKNLHVQGFSKWAPANIGPYSQANLIGQSEVVMLAGQIGLNPGLMILKPTLAEQLIQIIVNYNNTIKEAIQNKDKNPDLIQKTVVKIILYISKDVSLEDVELQGKIAMVESYLIPLVIIRVSTLPKNAPLEIEMVSIPDKVSLEQEGTENKITLKREGDICYMFAKYTSLEELLDTPDIFGA